MAKEHYVPTVEDVAWARLTVGLIAHGGVMVWPATMIIWRVDQTAKTLRCINPELLELYPDLLTLTRAVFGAIGYKIVDGESE